MEERGLKVLCMFMHAFRTTEISSSTVIEIYRGISFSPLKDTKFFFFALLFAAAKFSITRYISAFETMDSISSFLS
jgi:hypothetical protein